MGNVISLLNRVLEISDFSFGVITEIINVACDSTHWPTRIVVLFLKKFLIFQMDDLDHKLSILLHSVTVKNFLIMPKCS